MHFQPYPTRSGFIFLGLALLAGLLAILLINLLPRQSDIYHLFILLTGALLAMVGMGLAFYWAILAFQLHYYLSRNGLVIRWGLAQQRIPLESIQEIVPGHALAAAPTFVGLNIAGLRLGWGNLADYGRVKFHTTTALAESLFVVTPQQTYVISPSQPDQFLQAWQTRQSLGPTQKWTIGWQWGWPFNYPILTDRLTWWLLGLAFLAGLALLGYLTSIFVGLPRSLPIHFDAFGVPDRIADKSALLTLPTVGLAIFVINGLLGILVYRWEKVAAYLLWGSALALQICLWVAALSLTS